MRLWDIVKFSEWNGVSIWVCYKGITIEYEVWLGGGHEILRWYIDLSSLEEK